jgi:restriction system protein
MLDHAMPVPAFNDYLLPVLRYTADGAEHTIAETVDAMAKHFGLSDADIAEMLPSGTQARHQNRVYWARTYLAKAALLDAVGRGRFRITQRGKELLATSPARIDRATLVQYPEFKAFSQQTGVSTAPPAVVHEETETPEERLESNYQSLRSELAERLLVQVMKSSPAFFERLVVDVLVAMGYGGSRADAGKAVGQVGDGGIDGIIKEDRLGLDIVYIQAKRWEGLVGSPAVRDFVGSLVGHSASKGVLIATSRFSKDAEDYARKIPQKVVLIDGAQLANLMMDFGVGVTTANTYTVKKLDLDYFGEE